MYGMRALDQQGTRDIGKQNNHNRIDPKYSEPSNQYFTPSMSLSLPLSGHVQAKSRNSPCYPYPTIRVTPTLALVSFALFSSPHQLLSMPSPLFPRHSLRTNLSGTSFMTTRDTLARNPQTYFAAMLRMQTPTTPSSGTDTSVLSGSGGGGGEEDATGGGSCSSGVEFFIDRDPTHFR